MGVVSSLDIVMLTIMITTSQSPSTRVLINIRDTASYFRQKQEARQLLIKHTDIATIKRLVITNKPFRNKNLDGSVVSVSVVTIARVVSSLSIGSKPADMLVPNHYRSPRMQDSSWELQGMNQQGEEGLLLVSKHRGWWVGSCFHTWEVGMGILGLE